MAAYLASAAGLVPEDSVGTYLQWGLLQISLANLIVILLMVAVFAIALFAPFPGSKR
jgi:hypothetical protein